MNITYAVEAAFKLPGISNSEFHVALKRALTNEASVAYRYVANLTFKQVSKKPMVILGSRNTSAWTACTYPSGGAKGYIYFSSHASIKYLKQPSHAAVLQSLFGLCFHEWWHLLAYVKSNQTMARRKDTGPPLKADQTAWLRRLYGNPLYRDAGDELPLPFEYSQTLLDRASQLLIHPIVTTEF